MDTKEGIQNFNSTANLTSSAGFQSTLSLDSKDVKDEKPYNPFEHRQVTHPNSTIGSIVHLLKACLGTGILAMPAAFKNAGLIAGSIGTLFTGLICTHTLRMLVGTAQKLCVDARVPSMSFSETCGAAFTYGPKRLQHWGNFVKLFVDYTVSLTYLGGMCVYVVFIGSSFKEVFDVLVPEFKLTIQMYCLLTLLPLVLLVQIRNLKYLVPFSAFANALIVVVYGITMYYMFSDLPPLSEREMVVDVRKWPLFFSTAVFAMEGVGVVMPMENEMANPKQFLACPGVLNTAMVIIISLFTVFGFFGYLQYGDEVKGSITLNLPQEILIAQIAKLLMAFVIYFSYALQCYVPMEVITRTLKQRQSDKYENLIQISIRTLLVIISIGVAAAFPNLELVIGLVGAIFLSTLGLLLPAIIDSIYRWERDCGRFNWILYKNYVIIAFSIFAAVSGAYVSIVGMIEEFGPGRHVTVSDDDNLTLFDNDV